jgi:hypothetical protein
VAATATSVPLRVQNGLPDRLPPGDYRPREPEPIEFSDDQKGRQAKEALLKRAKVWREPADPIERANLGRNPPGLPDEIACKYKPEKADGTTPKFECVLPGGEVVKVKYGSTSEIPAEIAATRLLSALGFGADRMYLLRTVRCFGCPRSPFRSMQLAELTHVGRRDEADFDYNTYSDFEWPAVERKFAGRPIVHASNKGWGWYQLEKIDHAAGGASRAEVDALRLIAVFLAHWDNKSENQRLVCVDADAGASCDHPFALLQDVGATFGPNKSNLRGWRSVRIWKDPASCLVSLKTLPYQGGTFEERRISEAGREWLARRLTRLSRSQIADLFKGSQMAEPRHWWSSRRTVGGWADAFDEKVQQIVKRAPCPS